MQRPDKCFLGGEKKKNDCKKNKTKAKLLSVSGDRKRGGCEAGLMMEGVE